MPDHPQRGHGIREFHDDLTDRGSGPEHADLGGISVQHLEVHGWLKVGL